MPAGDVDAQDKYTPGTGSSSSSSPVGGLSFGSPGTTSSGGSKGSGTGKAAAKASALATLRRYFINLGLGAGMANWAYGLLRKGYDMEGVLAELYNQPKFKHAFPGIFRKDGSLIVSPQEYRQLTEAYQSVGAQYGFKLSKADLGKLVQGENSVEEAKTKLRAAQVVDQNRDVWKYMGFKTAKEAQNFILGKADRDVYDRYEAAAIRTALAQSGVGGIPSGVTGSRARELARQTGGVLDFDEIAERAAKVAEQVKFAAPELMARGISQRDIEDVMFGRPTAGVLTRVEAALEQRKASFKQKGQSQQVARGVKGRPVVAGVQQEAGF